MQRALYVLIAGALALTGCVTDDGDPSATPSPDVTSDDPAATSTPSPTTSPTATASPSPDDDGVAAMAFTTCEAPEFTIGHPAEWQTNDPDGLTAPCRVFHPDAVELPDEPQGIDLHWAAHVRIDNVAYTDVTGAEPTGEVLAERETTVADRDARITEVRSSGDALVPDGEVRYGWAVDLDGRTLFAQTYSVGETDYERDKQVLDRMMEQLELTVTEPVAGPATTDRTTAEASGDPVVLTALDAAGHGTFDRLVFEIGGEGTVGWDVAYEDDPRSAGSGAPVEVEGEATLGVTLTGVALPPEAPVEPRDGPERVQPEGTSVVREVLDDTVYEGRHDLFVGVAEQRPYRVELLTDPQRLVVDVETG